MGRLAVLRPHLDDGVPLARAARHAGIPVRTAERWLSRYRRDGIAGLARSTRSDAGKPRLPPELVALVEGIGLKRPRSAAAAIQRRALEVAKARGWPAPSYGTVHAILARLDPAMVTLAHEGAAAFRDRYQGRCVMIDVDAARLLLLLAALRLPTIGRHWESFAARADAEGWGAARYLTAL